MEGRFIVFSDSFLNPIIYRHKVPKNHFGIKIPRHIPKWCLVRMIGIGKPPTSTMATPTILANHSAPQGCGCNGLPRRLGESLTQWEGCRFVPQKRPGATEKWIQILVSWKKSLAAWYRAKFTTLTWSYFQVSFTIPRFFWGWQATRVQFFIDLWNWNITSYHKFSSSYKDMKFDYIF